MASSFNSSSCQLKCFLSPCRQLKYSSSSSRQLKCFLSPTRGLKYSSSSSRQLKYSFSPSRQLKYSFSPCCQLEDSSSASSEWEYHVFLSFRSETRHNFTTQLLQDLKDTGMNVFFDEQKLEKAKEFLPDLIQAIALSKLSIIILSPEYASSDKCLTELSNIMDRKRTQQHMVLPIFYKVDPFDVQNPDGSFKPFFAQHKSNRPLGLDEVNKWEAAFAEVGTLDGIHIKGDKDDRPETEHIKHIVEYAIHKLMKHQVFLSIGEDTRPNFSDHLLKALKDTGINAVSDEGEQFSQAIAASDISIIVLSEKYVSSESCSAQLSDIMELKRTQKHIVLPIFYHINPSDVPKLCGSQWRKDFANVVGLQGFCIEGGEYDRHNTEYVKDIVQCVIKELNRKSKRVPVDLVGIDQIDEICKLVKQEDKRIIGLWGIAGIGKTSLAEAVYNEMHPDFESHFFLQNAREEIENKGMISVRNELLSTLLGEKIVINTPTIVESFIQKRLQNKRTIVVLDDIKDSDQIKCMGVDLFGAGSKIIVTCRDRQVLENGGADKIYKVKKLNENDSLQLFHKFAFRTLNPAPEFRDLSYKFLGYAQGIPLALKVLGSKLYTKSSKVWESEAKKLEHYSEPTITQILKSSFDDLKEPDDKIFLDIACFFKGESRKNVEEILSCLYAGGAVSGIENLLDKCLLDIKNGYLLSMHDLLERMGKEIARTGSKDPRKHNRLWIPKDVNQVLKYDEENTLIEGIRFRPTGIKDSLLSCPHGFRNMLYLGYMDFSTPSLLSEKEKVLEDKVDSVSLPDELKYLRWDYFPFKSFSPSFNPENLVTLKLRSDRIEQLWNENHQDLDKLRVIDLCYCKKLRKIPNLSSAINLQRLECTGCESLVELPRLSHLTSLEKLDFEGCHKLRKFPELPNIFLELNLSHTEIEEVPDSIEHLGQLKKLSLQYSRVEHISSNISKLESLRELDLFACGSLKTLSELPRYLLWLDADECTSLEKVSFADHNSNPFHSLQDGDDDALRKEDFFMSFSNCRSLNQDSIENIAVNAMLQIESLAQRWARKKAISQEKHKRVSFGYKLLCCFPGNEVPANVFNCISMNYSLTLKITPNGFSGSRFLAFAICLVADLTHANDHLEVICKYQLTDASGEKFTRKPHFFDSRPGGYRGDHVLILLSKDMVLIDNDYEEASFEFYIRDNAWKDIEVEKCGVHVFYVDAESYIIIDDKSKPNFDSAIEMRPEDERRFGIDCEEGDGGP